ncbi:HAMP domain-containing methyl-accepting chemotaxis protein [Clostridium boliviensis]|uniref:HAMP domain-containing methyl-accepting chemotaxis protein n=1 Tax=Clostridium boliviensis TaxID=318465 RepID=A0ABU4GHH7_9CLOT|nr:HAMP domain-containing methyl-accepting chemotaxis protein [Clostridium boliviensis]MDW2797072.1 HAMP domain-containing methyl-accepting chemotaxis protein [Clostridium boliviensis]
MKDKRGFNEFIRGLSVKWKLSIGFGVVFLILLVSLGTSAASISKIGNQVDLYSKFTYPLTYNNLVAQREAVSVQRFLLMALLEKEAGKDYKPSLDMSGKSAQNFMEVFDKFAKNQRSAANDKNIADVNQHVQEAEAARNKILELLNDPSTKDSSAAYKIFQEEFLPPFNQITDIMEQMNLVGAQKADIQKQTAKGVIAESWVILLVVLVASVLATLSIIFILTRAILKPVKEIEEVYKEMAEGNLRSEIHYESRDELGRMADSIRTTNARLTSYIEDIISKLTMLSQGNMSFTVDLDYVGDFSAIKESLLSTIASLNSTMQVIHTAAEQVNSGAGQVSDASQALASGATEQAATIEELTASVHSVTEKAEKNTVSVRNATESVFQAGQGVGESNNRMKQLNEAMREISHSSEEISKVTKIVEDIAFQTNILALNAAVEAARAGEAGKGFAVVADEVRNLAAKSAEAAKQTADLVQKSTDKVAEGERMANESLKLLDNVAVKADLVDKAIKQIESDTQDQANAIVEINQGLSQVSAVVQTNAATAEESSASSEELAAQAQILREQISKFKLTNVTNTTGKEYYTKRAVEPESNQSAAFDSASGKY